jgi:hypothetical protein
MSTLIKSAVIVTPTAAEIALGSTLQLSATATGTMSDGSTVSLGVLCESDCPAIATVNQSGLVTATTSTNAVPYFTAGGRVVIRVFALRKDGSPIGAPAQCPVTVLGAGAPERTGKKS